MKEFNLLCKEAENMSLNAKYAFLSANMEVVVSKLSVVLGEEQAAGAAFAFLMGAIVADGKLSPEEYRLCAPIVSAFYGTPVSYEFVKQDLESDGKGARMLKKTVDGIADLLGLLDADLKTDVVLLCLVVCGVDGEISHKEKKWIKRLIK